MIWPLAASLTLLGAGAIPPPAAAASAGCEERKARFAIGRPYSPTLARDAARRAGARLVRKLAPGQIVTMEFSPHRLNLEVDRRGGVRAARCG